MVRSIEDAEARIAQLERLVSALRHDIAGALTPALMVADRLRSNPEPTVALAGEKIAASILRATKLAKASRDIVPSLR